MKNILNEKPNYKPDLREKRALSYIDLRDIENKKILNIGCGWGGFELQAIHKGAKEIIGIEPTQEGISTAVRYIEDDNIEFKIASATELPFDDKSFDTVTSWEVLEHIPRKMENTMFEEVYRVLKSGGNFYISTPRATFISKVLDPAWWLIGHRHYSLEQLKDFGNNSGLDLVEYHTYADIWELLYTINQYIAKWVFRRKPFYEKFFQIKMKKEFMKETGRSTLWCKFHKA